MRVKGVGLIGLGSGLWVVGRGGGEGRNVGLGLVVVDGVGWYEAWSG